MNLLNTYEKIEKDQLKEVCDTRFGSYYYKHYEKLFKDAIKANCDFYYYDHPFILIVLKTNIENIVNTTPYELYGFGFTLYKTGNIAPDLILKPNSDTIYRVRTNYNYDSIAYRNFSLNYMTRYSNNTLCMCRWCYRNIKDTDSQKIWLGLRNAQNPVGIDLGCKNCVNERRQQIIIDKIANKIIRKIKRII